MSLPKPLLRKVDCLEFYVPDLEAGIAFYCDQLGHELKWRTPTAAGLYLPESDAEIVLQTERQRLEADMLVDAADEAVLRFTQAGGTILVAPFDIPVGRCAVVADPWGNRFVLLDLSKGLFKTDEQKNVIGVEKPAQS
ncbi:MAG TPA: VOC family protein [Phototrophicaceae bacterium]|nr:VOC family protein [Phototrophicaceae bacterium]